VLSAISIGPPVAAMIALVNPQIETARPLIGGGEMS
jgi:hypothetical protein